MSTASSEVHLPGVAVGQTQPSSTTVQEYCFLSSIFSFIFEGHVQLLIGAVLLILIYINICLTSLAWRRYSNTIVLFFEEEKLRKEKEVSEGKYE